MSRPIARSAAREGVRPAHATVPKHITARGITARAWRAQKRREIAAALKAVHAVRIGCAFIPTGTTQVDRAAQSLEALRVACSVKAWKR